MGLPEEGSSLEGESPLPLSGYLVVVSPLHIHFYHDALFNIMMQPRGPSPKAKHRSPDAEFPHRKTDLGYFLFFLKMLSFISLNIAREKGLVYSTIGGKRLGTNIQKLRLYQ